MPETGGRNERTEHAEHARTEPARRAQCGEREHDAKQDHRAALEAAERARLELEHVLRV